ncbi:MAG: hypothetical protein P4L53_17645 [Candidatus Obscuribacterales bacterium]|nr:hypothetical protein [Candidatus Obscuribacterales bacterium]
MSRVRSSKRKCAQVAKMLVVAILLTASSPALAIYDRLAIEHVPIERVINNLNQQIAAKPDLRGQNEFKIARLYAMAFALNADRLPVNNRFYALQQDSQTWLTKSSYDDVIYSTDHSQVWPEFRQFKNESGAKTKSAIKCLQVAIEHYRVALRLDKELLNARNI